MNSLLLYLKKMRTELLPKWSHTPPNENEKTKLLRQNHELLRNEEQTCGARANLENPRDAKRHLYEGRHNIH